MIKEKILFSPEFENYEIKVIQKRKEFYLRIEELSLIVKSSNLDQGLINLKKRFSEVYSLHKDSGNEENLPKPTRIIKKYEIIRELQIFILKFSIIGFIFLLVAVFSATFISMKVKQVSVVDIIKSEVRKVMLTVDEKLPKNEIEKKEQIEVFKSYIRELKPYLDEINSIN